MKKYVAEMIGTMVLVLMGCGSAVIAGAVFGDKLSPLSETTNLAPACAGTELYTHIKSQLLDVILIRPLH